MRDNVAIGRKSQALGQQFEGWVEQQHEMAMHLGILAHIEKTQARARVIGGRLQYESKGVADYIGCLESVGVLPAQYLAVEAKYTSKDYLPRAEVSPKQQAHLDAVARAGGLALLVVEYRFESTTRAGLVERERVAIPWLEVKWSVKRSAESVSMDDLIEFGWRVLDPCYLSRWHKGGPRSSTSGGAKPRKYPRE